MWGSSLHSKQRRERIGLDFNEDIENIDYCSAVLLLEMRDFGFFYIADANVGS